LRSNSVSVQNRAAASRPLTTDITRPSSGFFLSSVVAENGDAVTGAIGNSPLRAIEARE